MPEILPTPDGKEPAEHVDCFFQALASGSLAPQGADDRIKGPVNQRPLLKQGQPAAPHFMSQFNSGFLNNLQPHPVHKDKAVCFVNDGG